METSTRRGLPRAMVDDVFLAPVHINAGGTVYTTTLDTLTKYPESKLAKLFDGTLAISIDPISRQYFLDVNGSVFAHVLDFLRYGELLLPEDFTQLPLLIKLAVCFEMQDMIQALINMGGEGSSGTDEEGRNTDKQKKKKRRNKKHLGIVSPSSESHENHKSSLELEKMDSPVETGKMHIGTCELGIVKLGMLEGGKVEFGTIESATMKGKTLETDILAVKATETEKLSTGNIESEIIEAKSSKVELLKADQIKSETVDMEKVKAGNVEMQTVDAVLTKVEMLETKAVKSQTVEMEMVSAANVEIKSLESETLKLKSLEVGTLTANFCSLSTKPESVKLDTVNSTSDIVLVHSAGENILLFTTDRKLKVGLGEFLYDDHYDHGCKVDFYKFTAHGGVRYAPTNQTYFELFLLKLFQTLIKNGYKLCNMAGIEAKNHTREYVFCK